MDLTKEQRIKKEITALRRQYKCIDKLHKANAERLIARAAYQKATLDDLEADLDANGWTEPFQQSDKCDPYDRKRPNVDLYVSISAQYLRTMKQLDAMLPKSSGNNATNDELIAFLDND